MAAWIAVKLDLKISSALVILSDDRTLREMHKEYLDDDSLTDVITFNLSESDAVEAEIYISAERAVQNASRFKTTLRNELMRLVIHACLHLAGYDDTTESKRKIMKQKEEQYLTEAEGVFAPE